MSTYKQTPNIQDPYKDLWNNDIHRTTRQTQHMHTKVIKTPAQAKLFSKTSANDNKETWSFETPSLKGFFART